MNTPNSGSQSQSWKQTYLFDRFGNRRFDTTSGATTTIPGTCSTAVCNPTFDLSNNRFASGQGYSYDSAGNVTQDADGKKFVYDAENKQKSFGTGGDDDNGGTYFYDGDGRRVKTIVGTEITIFVYDGGGKMVAEYATTAPSSPQINYLTADTLGSPRINTDGTGAVIARHDYMPFGEDLTIVGGRVTGLRYLADSVRQQFTTYERDGETNLEFAQSRFYNRFHGRFSSPDNFLSDTSVSDSSSWNLYVYCRNNPLNLVDPSGEGVYLGYISDPDQLAEFLRRVNFTYGCEDCASVDSDGYLSVDTSGLGQDILAAAKFLTDAIVTRDRRQLFAVEIANNSLDVGFGDSSTKVGVKVTNPDGSVTTVSAVNIRLDFADDEHVIGGDEYKASFLNLVFAHEVSHFAPSYKQDPLVRGVRGPVDNPINEIRTALQLPLRYDYPGHGGMGNMVTLQMGRGTLDASGNLRRQGDGITVYPTRLIIYWQNKVKVNK